MPSLLLCLLFARGAAASLFRFSASDRRAKDLIAASLEEQDEGSQSIEPGDVFAGTLGKCERGKNIGFRLHVETWPEASAKVGFFPLAHWNTHERAFDKPTHELAREWRVVNGRGKMLDFERVGGNTSGNPLEFGLRGKLDGDVLRGDLLWAGHEKEGPRFKPDNLQDYPFFCSEFSATKCRAGPPQEDEKVVVFMRHGSAGSKSDDPHGNDGSDPRLNSFGESQIKERLFDPNLAKVMSQDPQQQAQVVLVSPLVRAMQTALTMFGARLKSAKWELEPNIVEMGSLGSILPSFGEELLREFNATVLLDQYRTFSGMITELRKKPPRHQHHEHQDRHQSNTKALNMNRQQGAAAGPLFEDIEATLQAKPWASLAATSDSESAEEMEAEMGPELSEQFARFTARVLERPESRFVAVSHKHILKAGIDVILEQTQTVVMGLSPKGRWRRLDPPYCWPGPL